LPHQKVDQVSDAAQVSFLDCALQELVVTTQIKLTEQVHVAEDLKDLCILQRLN
jgi:hypothetical protein